MIEIFYDISLVTVGEIMFVGKLTEVERKTQIRGISLLVPRVSRIGRDGVGDGVRDGELVGPSVKGRCSPVSSPLSSPVSSPLSCPSVKPT